MFDIVIVGIQVLLMLSIVLTPILGSFFPMPTPFEFPGIVHCLSLLGIAWTLLLLALGGLKLGKYARISPMPAKRAVLRTTGAYAFCRHPMYSGIIGAAFFYSLYLASPFALMCTFALGIVLYFKASKEEKYLNKIFGADYKTYSKEVGMFFPKKF